MIFKGFQNFFVFSGGCNDRRTGHVPSFCCSGISDCFWNYTCPLGKSIVPFALVLFALILGVVQGGSVLVNVTDNPDVLRFGPYVLAVLLAVAVSFIYRIAFFLAGLFIGYFLCSSFFPELSSVLVETRCMYLPIPPSIPATNAATRSVSVTWKEFFTSSSRASSSHPLKSLGT